MSYAAWKHLHVSAVVLSLAGFVLRGWWMASGSPMLGRRWVRIVPHVVDTLLLASALVLLSYFLAAGLPAWIVAKIVGLLAYIALGTVALRRGRTRGLRLAAFAGALLAAAYVVGVALSKHVAGPFAFAFGAAS
ncbi:SirB2 family protein [Caldimonas tepidiphila]|uniref:SirB2 family protein n=1 Tax=Caldimonas tepidiphila TaxID=2315841 RepID=UPI000E5A4FE0|nr:SirB2 family protein [Caldimonas tepidiphila]